MPLRPLNADEREVIMGFPLGHTNACWKKDARKTGGSVFQDTRTSLVGNSFNVHSVAWLLGNLLVQLKFLPETLTPAQLALRTVSRGSSGVAKMVAGKSGARKAHIAPDTLRATSLEDVSVIVPGAKTARDTLRATSEEAVSVTVPVASEAAQDNQLATSEEGVSVNVPVEVINEEAVVRAICRGSSFKSTDIRQLALGSRIPHQWPRQSIPADWWRWRVILAFKWKQVDPEHVNILELRAFLSYIKWLSRKPQLLHHRFFHLLDSQVCLAVVSKGRSSSFALSNVLEQCNALVLAGGMVAYVGYVDTKDNPADAPSRWRDVHKKKH